MIGLFLQCCERFLAKDDDFLRRLRQDGFVCDDGWNFTLPQLHRFLAGHMQEGQVPAYRSFRRQLFNSPINTSLADCQAEIAIADNQGKVDLSTYRLQRIPTTST